MSKDKRRKPPNKKELQALCDGDERDHFTKVVAKSVEELRAFRSGWALGVTRGLEIARGIYAIE